MTAPGGQRGSVLVVDDDPCIREIVTAILSSQGYACSTAVDGAEAVDLLEKRPVDVVVTDLRMPRLGGMELMDLVQERWPGTDVIVITGHDEEGIYSKIIDAGGIDFISKPFEADELAAKVNRVFRERTLIRGLEREVAERRITEAALQAAKTEIETACAGRAHLIKDLYVIMDEMLANRDHYTFEHALRVAEISRRTARRLGLAAEETEILEQACLIHDIGKIAIPDDVLLKPGHFAPQDRDIMRLHPLLGANLFGQRHHDPRMVFIIRHHHERLDGSGYPDGLGAGELGILVRIAAAADVFEALVARRPYKKAMSRDQALDIMAGEAAGGRLDPEVVRVLGRVVADWDPLAIRRQPRADYLGQLEIFRTMSYFREPLTDFYNYRYIYFLDDIQVLKRNVRPFALMLTAFADQRSFYRRARHTVADQVIDEVGQHFHDAVEAVNAAHGHGECLARLFRKGSNYLFYLERATDLDTAFADLRAAVEEHLLRLGRDWGLLGRVFCRTYPAGHPLELALDELFGAT